MANDTFLPIIIQEASPTQNNPVTVGLGWLWYKPSTDTWYECTTASPIAWTQVVDSAIPAAISSHAALTTGVHGAGAGTILGTLDVDDTPVDNATTAPVSSNWAYDHVAAADPHTGYLLESTLHINTILKADADHTPIELAVDEQTLVGRITGGVIAALTRAQIWSIIRGYAGAYLHENATPLTIEEANTPHALHGLTQGHLSTGWVFYAGKSLSITAFATSDAGTKTQVTVATHGLANGDVVTIANTTSYDGIYNIEQVAENTFVIQKAWVADDGVQVGHAAAYFTNTNAISTGIYLACGTASCTPANANDVFEFEFYLDTTELTNTESQIKLGGSGDFSEASTQGIIEYTAGQKFWAKTENKSGAGDITVRDCNFTLVRIG